jgi:hypothetical protein
VHVQQRFTDQGGAPYVRAYLDSLEPALQRKLDEERRAERPRAARAPRGHGR